MSEHTINTEQLQVASSKYPAWLSGLFIFCVAVCFYMPGWNNEYALDDGILIHQNNYVLQGVAGIKDILTKDTYHAFYYRMNATDQLSGGRYRPLPSITYALEQQMIHPYRTGYYLFVEDVDKDGVLDKDPVTQVNSKGTKLSVYEYNDFVDKNNDQAAQPDECYNCWDINRNFINDPEEDLNVDGVFNEVDCQVYGAPLRHVVNIILYGICCLLIFKLFNRYFFREEPLLAFTAALVFAMHPVHSEVVANVRGRDDILSMIFIALTFIQSFRYMENRKNLNLLLAAASFFLALMSKEYAGVLFILLPVALHVFRRDENKTSDILPPILVSVAGFTLMYLTDLWHFYLMQDQLLTFISLALFFSLLISFVFRKGFESRNISALMSSLAIAAFFYLGLRLNAVNVNPGVPDTEILNNPYLLASQSQALATKIFMLLVALRLAVFPHPLVSDYSYNSYPYRELYDPLVLVAILIFTMIVAAGIILVKRRNPLGFALLSYFTFLIVVSNIIFPTHIKFLESFLFHANLGFSILFASAIIWLAGKVSSEKMKPVLSVLFLVVLLIPAGMKAWERSRDWKNDVTLFLKDVNNAPNSVLVLGNAGARWIDLADTREITGLTMPGQDSTKWNDYNGTLHITDEELRQGGYADKREAALYKGIGYLEHAVELHPRYVNGYLNLGLAYYKVQNDDKCILYWKLAERLYPNNPYLRNYYQVYTNLLRTRGSRAFDAGDYRHAVKEYARWAVVTPADPDAWYNLGGALFNLGAHKKAKEYFMKARAMRPGYKPYQDIMELYKPFREKVMPDKTKNQQGC